MNSSTSANLSALMEKEMKNTLLKYKDEEN
jgi:hypothetical protein